MRKKLLSEAQVRRFQSLASIRPLHEMDSSYKKDDEAYMGHEDTMMEEEEMEMDDESEMDEADVEMDEELVQKFMDAVDTMQQVADVLNPEGGMGAMDDEGGMDAMDDAGEEPMELDAGEEGEEDEEAMLEEALRGISYVPSQKEVVKVVAQRVAKRLQEAKRAEARLNRALGKRR